jgi:transposase
VRNASLWCALLGVEKTVIEDVEFAEAAEAVIAHVRPRRLAKGRCGV